MRALRRTSSHDAAGGPTPHGLSVGDLSNITLAVLAGGEGRRMGVAKGRLNIGEKPILLYLLGRFAWPGPTLLVTAPGREHPPGWEAFGGEAVDPEPGLGPLRGVQTALENAATDELLVTTVDMPGVGAEELRWLAATFRARRTDGMAPAGMMTERAAGTASQGAARQVEPFPAVFHRSAGEVIGLRLRHGRLSVHGLATEPGFLVVPSPAAWGGRCWVNLNRPEDLERYLRGGGGEEQPEPIEPGGPGE